MSDPSIFLRPQMSRHPSTSPPPPGCTLLSWCLQTTWGLCNFGFNDFLSPSATFHTGTERTFRSEITCQLSLGQFKYSCRNWGLGLALPELNFLISMLSRLGFRFLWIHDLFLFFYPFTSLITAPQRLSCLDRTWESAHGKPRKEDWHQKKRWSQAVEVDGLNPEDGIRLALRCSQEEDRFGGLAALSSDISTVFPVFCQSSHRIISTFSCFQPRFLSFFDIKKNYIQKQSWEIVTLPFLLQWDKAISSLPSLIVWQMFSNLVLQRHNSIWSSNKSHVMSSHNPEELPWRPLSILFNVSYFKNSPLISIFSICVMESFLS